MTLTLYYHYYHWPVCLRNGGLCSHMIILLLVIGHCYHVVGQFPRECIENATKPEGRCCPTWFPQDGGGGTCGGSNRGICLPLDDVTEFFFPAYESHHHDDRLNWPTAFFTWVCHCNGNFAGYKCQECQFGFYGKDCSQRRILKRRNIFSLSKEERQRFVNVVLRSKHTIHEEYVAIKSELHDPVENYNFVNVSVYDFFIYIHCYSARNTYFRNQTMPCQPSLFNYDFSHKGSGFPTFHRLLMLMWERELQKLSGDDTLTIPYWDWVNEGEHCSVCTNDLFGALNLTDPKGHIDSRSPFYKWYSLCEMAGSPNVGQVSNTSELHCRFCDPTRKFGGIVRRRDPMNSRLPSLQEVDKILAMSKYDNMPYNKYAGVNFRNCFEGNCPEDGLVYSIHNLVHAFFNGSLSGVTTSPNDPLFLVHHSMIDKLFERWLRMHKPHSSQMPVYGAPVGHNRDALMVPFFPRHRHSQYFIDSRTLGYDYEDFNYGGQRRRDPETYLDSEEKESKALLVLGMAVPFITSFAFVIYMIITRFARGGAAYQTIPLPPGGVHDPSEKLQSLLDNMSDTDSQLDDYENFEQGSISNGKLGIHPHA